MSPTPSKTEMKIEKLIKMRKSLQISQWEFDTHMAVLTTPDVVFTPEPSYWRMAAPFLIVGGIILASIIVFPKQFLGVYAEYVDTELDNPFLQRRTTLEKFQDVEKSSEEVTNQWFGLD